MRMFTVTGSYNEKRIAPASDMFEYVIDVFKDDVLQMGMNSDDTNDDLDLVIELADLVREDPEQIVSLEWEDYGNHSLIVLKPWYEEPKQKESKVIHVNDEIIGYSWDVAEDIENNLPNIDKEDRKMFEDLLAELSQHDGLVVCSYNPMGAYYVRDVYFKN